MRKDERITLGVPLVYRNWSFQARRAPNTSASRSRARPARAEAAARTAGTSQRRNGFTRISRDIWEGREGLLRARSSLTLSWYSRAAWFSGSTVKAKRRLAAVYS